MVDLRRIGVKQIKFLIKVVFFREVLFPILSLPIFPGRWKHVVHVRFLHPFIYKNIFHPTITKEVYNRFKKDIESGTWTVSKLRRSFRNKGVDLSMIPDDLFLALKESAISLDDKEGVEHQSRLIKFIKDIDYKFDIGFKLIELYNFLIRCGLFVAGLHLREKIKKFIETDINNAEFTDRGKVSVSLGFMLEHGEVDLFDACFDNRSQNLSSTQVKLLNELRSILCDSTFKPSLDFTSNDLSFKTYIEDRHIAIVAPAKSSEEDGSEIDKFDRVVRISYSTQNIRLNQAVKGSKIDISYLISPASLYLFNHSKYKYDSKINWIVFQGVSMGKHFISNILESKNKEVNEKELPQNRSIVNYNPILINSTLNTLPHIVLDLVKFSPSKIFIYHADFMLTVMRYKGYYNSKYSKFNKHHARLLRSLKSFSSGHDPFLQFNIVKRLYDANKICGDSRFTEVINFTPLDFAKELQSVYGEVGRIQLKNKYDEGIFKE